MCTQMACQCHRLTGGRLLAKNVKRSGRKQDKQQNPRPTKSICRRISGTNINGSNFNSSTNMIGISRSTSSTTALPFVVIVGVGVFVVVVVVCFQRYVSAVHEGLGEFFIFGGYDGSSWLNDLHEYSFATKLWKKTNHQGQIPSGRSCPSWATYKVPIPTAS
eukprot:GHVT01000087.1.p1 GENE.GHVT01000087.1~~GHVT01000087.1.p1  ORF type:complete len:162 (+),score=8.15 GHVT01000087.1:218-703(+)